MEQPIIPYQLPETENHSFFFIDQRTEPCFEAKLHQHDAWELYYEIKGRGKRLAGDTLEHFEEGDVVLIPPMMHHHWDYDESSVDDDGCIHYLMVAFSHSFIQRSMAMYPEFRNAMQGVDFPTNALKFGKGEAKLICNVLSRMCGENELQRLCSMLVLLPSVFSSSDHILAGKPIRLERDAQRLQQISSYVMAHFAHNITLDDIAKEVGMNRSSFCIYFKSRKGMTFSNFVSKYRMDVASELLKTTNMQVSEICYKVGFNDLPHFVRMFSKAYSISPTKYRKKHQL